MRLFDGSCDSFGKIKEVNRSICFNIDSHGVFSRQDENADLIFTGYFRKFF